MSSYDISNVDDDGSVNLAMHDDQIVIEMYDHVDDNAVDQRDIQLFFNLDQAKEIHAHLGHLIYLAEYGDTTSTPECDSEIGRVFGTKQS